jgi:hypothetical protein
MLASVSDSHLEWHRNANVPIGFSCPWDACDPALLSEEEVQRLLKVQADNAAAEEAWANSPEAQATCVHGMSAWLCEDPISHYGRDYD